MEPRRRRPLSLAQWLARLTGQETVLLAVCTFLVGLLGNSLANFLGNWKLGFIPGDLIIILGILGIVLVLYAVYRRRTRGPILGLDERHPEGKSGLILLLSTINPRFDGTKDEIQRQREEFEAHLDRICECEGHELQASDFAPLERTNLVPAVRALEYHWQAGTLRDCWTIGTPNEAGPDGSPRRGSACLGPVLERWFYHRNPRHMVHFAQTEVVGAREYWKLSQVVNRIFRNAPYRAKHIICDITGGLKMMSVGVALACLSPGRSMQYMASDRDWQGNPIPRGEMKPVLLDINLALGIADEAEPLPFAGQAPAHDP